MGRQTVLRIKEDWVNETEGYRSGDSGWYEPFTDDPGRLFRSLQREWGRCTGKLYRDLGDQILKCGWVFEKRREYDGCSETFLQSTWVEVEWGYTFEGVKK